jgi:hypothetical protein
MQAVPAPTPLDIPSPTALKTPLHPVSIPDRPHLPDQIPHVHPQLLRSHFRHDRQVGNSLTLLNDHAIELLHNVGNLTYPYSCANDMTPNLFFFLCQ